MHIRSTESKQVDQLANLHFRFTSVTRCIPMTVEVQRNTDGDTPSTKQAAIMERKCRWTSKQFWMPS